MADLKVISKVAIIFTFIALDAIPTSKGRSIKSSSEDELHAIDIDHMHEQESQFLTRSQSLAKDNHSDTAKERVPSPAAHAKAADLGELEAVYKDDFRPTTPGSSRGQGHSFGGSKKGGVQPKARSSDEEMLTVTETLGDIRPSGTGPSAGVGH